MARIPFVLISRAATLGTFVISVSISTAQSNQEWMGIKAKCGLSPGLVYNDWVAQGSPCGSGVNGNTPAAPAVPTTQQQAAQAIGQLGANMIGQGLHQLLYGRTADPAQHQRDVAVDQLNESGRYLYRQKDYAGALKEFEQALTLEPGNVNIQRNAVQARLRISEMSEAANRSQTLSAVLRSGIQGSGGLLKVPAAPINGPEAVRLSKDLGEDGSIVLTGDTPGSLKEQLDQVWGKPFQPPPDPMVQLPEARDIELLFQPPAPAIATTQNRAQPVQSGVDAVFSQSGADDVMEQEIEKSAIAGVVAPASSNATSQPGPHN